MRHKAFPWLIMAVAEMMSPQTINNPATGQTIQQQMIGAERKYKSRFGQRQGRVKTSGRLGNPFIVRNQRQKRKRWRQSPYLMMKQSRNK